MRREEPLYAQVLVYKTDGEYQKVQDKLDTERLLKFSDDKTPINLLQLIWYFFFKRFPTWYSEDVAKLYSQLGYQTSSNRARSLVDFYLIQKYYLKIPLTFKQCADTYFDAIPRMRWLSSGDRYSDKAILIKQVKSQPIGKQNYRIYTTSYCSTVQRNVFNASGINKIEDITLYNLAQIADGVSITKIPGKKQVKTEFIPLAKKAEVDRLEAERLAKIEFDKKIAKSKLDFERDLAKYPHVKFVELTGSPNVGPFSKVLEYPIINRNTSRFTMGYLAHTGLYHTYSASYGLKSMRRTSSNYNGYYLFEEVDNKDNNKEEAKARKVVESIIKENQNEKILPY